MMANETFENVWDALAVSPEEASNMALRSVLMDRVQSAVRAWDVPQAVAAQRLGISQPRLNELLKDRMSKFSLDALVIIASKAGLRVSLNIEAAAA